MALIIFLKILLGILLLLCIPIVFEFRQHQETELWVRFLFLRFKILPPKKPKQAKKTKPAQKPKTEKPKKKEKPLDLDIKAIFEAVAQIMPKLWKWVRWLVGTMAIYKLDIGITVARGDAAQTAESYGKVYAYVCTAINTLKNMFNLKLRTLHISPDFLGEKDQYYLYFRVRVIPLTVVVAAVNILIIAISPIIAPAFKAFTAKGKNKTIIKEEV